jgi:hypothetical protein
VTAIVAGSALVRAADLENVALRRLLERELAELELPPDDRDFETFVAEHVGAIDGGFALRARDTIVLEPGCCCGLDSIGEWMDAAGAADWQEVWVGLDACSRRALGRKLAGTC